MPNQQQEVVDVLQRAVDRAKPKSVELTYHPILCGPPESGAFTTIHVVASDGRPVDASFDFEGVAKELGPKARAKVEDRKVYSQSAPVPYKVITGAIGDWPFEIVFLLNAPA
ncbi:MAG: hypothetical protein HYX69_03205 [Planctomycetia bacterium]|nr:hypothetical protein [Planctomycetia bacterium]